MVAEGNLKGIIPFRFPSSRPPPLLNPNWEEGRGKLVARKSAAPQGELYKIRPSPLRLNEAIAQ